MTSYSSFIIDPSGGPTTLPTQLILLMQLQLQMGKQAVCLPGKERAGGGWRMMQVVGVLKASRHRNATLAENRMCDKKRCVKWSVEIYL